MLVFGVRRREDHAIGLKRRDGRAKLALDMVAVRIDEFDDHAEAVLRAFEHSAQQHLVDPVSALPRLPVSDSALAIVQGEDHVGSRTAHALCRNRRDIAELFDGGLHTLAHFGAHIGPIVDHAADRLQRNAGIRRHMFDRHRLAPPCHFSQTLELSRATAPRGEWIDHHLALACMCLGVRIIPAQARRNNARHILRGTAGSQRSCARFRAARQAIRPAPHHRAWRRWDGSFAA